MKTSLFISTQLPETNSLHAFCIANNWQIHAQSLIDFIPLQHEVNESFDVIFYSSKRCYQFFTAELKNSPSISIATIGSETARFLSEQDCQPQFIGQQSGQPEKVANEFKTWLGSRTVLFPSALHSKQTIANSIPANQKAVISVYETIFKSQHIEPHSWYVFTSPSNLNSFLSVNTLPKDAKVIAWGSTTQTACEQQGIVTNHCLVESNLDALVDFLKYAL